MLAATLALPRAELPTQPLPTRAQRHRCARVLGLTVAIALMSIADLIITLTYARSVGMPEDNPIARWVMSVGSPAMLIWWKLASVGLACLIFVLARRHRSAEVGAWICVLVLMWLTVRWTTYTHEISKLTPGISKLTAADDPKWVIMTN